MFTLFNFFLFNRLVPLFAFKVDESYKTYCVYKNIIKNIVL